MWGSPVPSKGWGSTTSPSCKKEDTTSLWTSSTQSSESSSKGWGNASSPPSKKEGISSVWTTSTKTSVYSSKGWDSAPSSSKKEVTASPWTTSTRTSAHSSKGWGSIPSSSKKEDTAAASTRSTRTSVSVSKGWGNALSSSKKEDTASVWASSTQTSGHPSKGWGNAPPSKRRPVTKPVFPSAPKKKVKQHIDEIVRCSNSVIIHREINETNYAFSQWQNMIEVFEDNLSKKMKIPRTREINGENYSLFSVKLDRRATSFSNKIDVPKLRMYYICLSEKEIQDELEKIGEWSALPSAKVLSRIELLLSTAALDNTKCPYAFKVESDLFEEIPENHNEGCGFIPEKMLEYFLGNGEVAEITSCVQARIVAQSLGIFKGNFSFLIF